MAVLKKTHVIGNGLSPDNFSWKDFGRIAVFIDASNVIYSLRDLGWKIDYKKLWRYFSEKSDLEKAYFYTAFFEADAGRKNLLEMLSRKGFVVRSKPVKVIHGSNNSIVHKANCDVELAMDVTLTHKEFDTAVIMSGDSDFVPLITFLHQQGKKVIIISTRGHVGKELIKSADGFFHFGQFKNLWLLEKDSNIKSGQSKSPAKRDSRRRF